MAKKSLDLFDDKNITLTYDDATLAGPVGSDPSEIVGFKAGGGPRDIPILGRTIELNNSLQARAEVLDGGQTTLFGQSLVLPDGTVPAALTIGANLDLAFASDIPLGSAGLWTLSLHANTDAAIGYRHLVPVNPDSTGLQVLQKSLFRNVTLPNFIDLQKIDGEAHELTATLDANFGGELSLNNFTKQFQYELGVLGEIFNGVALKASAEASLKASAGFGFNGKVVVTVSDLGVIPDQWVRIRVQREQTSKLSFGATLTLAVNQNLGSALTQILDNVLGLAPVQQGLGYLKEISTELQKIGTGDFSTITDKLSEEATDFALHALRVDDLLSSEKVADVVAKINDFLDQYNSLESRLSGLWDQLLMKADLGPDSTIRKTLELIANLDLSNIDAAIEDMLDPSFAQALALLETLTDTSLEKLLTDSGALDLLIKAQDAAKKALQLINTAPQQVMSAWQDWAQRKGVTGVIDWIENNATSVAALKNAAQTETRQAIERLLGKAINRINADDLQKVQDWAAKAGAAISSERIQAFEDRLRANLARLDAQFNARISIEIDRETRKSQLLDISVDPSHRDIRRAWKQMATLDIYGFMAALPEAQTSDDESDLAPLPYQINEALFVNTSIKTEVFSVFLSGLFSFDGKYTRRRLTEERVTVKDNKLQGSYSGAYFQESAVKWNLTWNATTSLEVEAQGTGLDRSKAYKAGASSRFRVAMLREDYQTETGELAAVIAFLNELGFSVSGDLTNQIPDGALTCVAVNVTFDAEAVKNFFAADINQWDESKLNPQSESVYLPAAARWYNTGLVNEVIARVPAGSLYASLIRSNKYLSYWPQRSIELSKDTRRGWTVQFNGRTIPLQRGLLNPVIFLQRRSKYGPGAFAEVEEKVGDLSGAYTGRQLFKAMEQFATACRKASPTAWDNPLFPFWLIKSRLERQGHPFTPMAGVATIRYQKDGEWQPTFTFAITN